MAVAACRQTLVNHVEHFARAILLARRVGLGQLLALLGEPGVQGVHHRLGMLLAPQPPGLGLELARLAISATAWPAIWLPVNWCASNSLRRAWAMHSAAVTPWVCRTTNYVARRQQLGRGPAAPFPRRSPDLVDGPRQPGCMAREVDVRYFAM